MGQTLEMPSWSGRLKPTKEWIYVGLILIVSFLGLIAWAQFRNALGVSRNDDWVYLHMEKWFLETGTFIVDSESMTNASGLVFTAAPVSALFGFSIGTLQIFVGVLGLVGIFATWILLRTFLDRFWAAVAVFSLVLTPYWGTLSLSFMTDVPAFTFQALGMLFFLYSVRGTKLNHYWAFVALGVSLVAFSYREYAIIGGLAISMAILLSSFRSRIRLKSRIYSGAFVLLFLLLAFQIYQWRSSLNNAREPQFLFIGSGFLQSIYFVTPALITIAIFSWPALTSGSLFLVFKRKSWWRITLSGALAVFLFLGAIKISLSFPLTIGNYFQAKGSYAETLPLGTFPNVLPEFVFTTLQWLGVLGFAIIGGLLFLVISEPKILRKFSIHRLPETVVEFPQAIVFLFVLGTISALAFVAGFTQAPLFDRYLLPLFPFVSALIISSIINLEIKASFAKIQTTSSLLLLGLLGFVYVDSALTLDGAQWRFASQLQSDGFNPETIDGGYMWFGYHQDEVATSAHLDWTKNWWTTLYKDPSICAQVGIGEVDPTETNNKELIQRFTARNAIGIEYKLWAIATPETCK